MTKRSLFTAGLFAATVLSGFALSGCAGDDEYGRGYTSMSVGVSSYDDDGYYRRHHHRDWGSRDYDRDGVPNRYDSAPRNPYRD